MAWEDDLASRARTLALVQLRFGTRATTAGFPAIVEPQALRSLQGWRWLRSSAGSWKGACIAVEAGADIIKMKVRPSDVARGSFPPVRCPS